MNESNECNSSINLVRYQGSTANPGAVKCVNSLLITGFFVLVLICQKEILAF